MSITVKQLTDLLITLNETKEVVSFSITEFSNATQITLFFNGDASSSVYYISHGV